MLRSKAGHPLVARRMWHGSVIHFGRDGSVRLLIEEFACEGAHDQRFGGVGFPAAAIDQCA
jgi:hypothetical protein